MSGHEVRRIRRPSLAQVHQPAVDKGIIMAAIQILTQISKIFIYYLDILILAKVRKYTLSSDDTERSQKPESDCDESPDTTRNEQVTSNKILKMIRK